MGTVSTTMPVTAQIIVRLEEPQFLRRYNVKPAETRYPPIPRCPVKPRRTAYLPTAFWRGEARWYTIDILVSWLMWWVLWTKVRISCSGNYGNGRKRNYGKEDLIWNREWEDTKVKFQIYFMTIIIVSSWYFLLHFLYYFFVNLYKISWNMSK